MHNPITAGLDSLPSAEQPSPASPPPNGMSSPPGRLGTSSAGLSPSPSATPPLQPGGIELAAAKPGAIINTASLEGLSHPVYCMTVQGSKVYSGLYNGNIQANAVAAAASRATDPRATPNRPA